MRDRPSCGRGEHPDGDRPRHADLKAVSLRLMGGSKHWHLHAGEGGLLEGKRPFTRERLGALLDGALQGKSTLAV